MFGEMYLIKSHLIQYMKQSFNLDFETKCQLNSLDNCIVMFEGRWDEASIVKCPMCDYIGNIEDCGYQCFDYFEYSSEHKLEENEMLHSGFFRCDNWHQFIVDFYSRPICVDIEQAKKDLTFDTYNKMLTLMYTVDDEFTEKDLKIKYLRTAFVKSIRYAKGGNYNSDYDSDDEINYHIDIINNHNYENARHNELQPVFTTVNCIHAGKYNFSITTWGD